MFNQYNGPQKSGPPPFARAAIAIILLSALFWFWMRPLTKIIGSIFVLGPEIKLSYKFSTEKVSPKQRYNQPLRQGQNIPQLWSAHLQAKSFLNQGNLEEAKLAAEKCLSIDPKFYRAYMHLGVVYSYQKNYALADQAFKSALRYVNLDPVDKAVDQERIFYNLGWNNLAMGNIDQAWMNFRAAYGIHLSFNDFMWRNDKYGILQYVAQNNRPVFFEAAGKYLANSKKQSVN